MKRKPITATVCEFAPNIPLRIIGKKNHVWVVEKYRNRKWRPYVSSIAEILAIELLKTAKKKEPLYRFRITEYTSGAQD